MSWLLLADPERLKAAGAALRYQNRMQSAVVMIKHVKRAAALNSGGLKEPEPVDPEVRRAKRKAKRKRGK